ncbi:MAG: BcsR/BcsP family cellulose biosynthesis protein [Pseudomonadota bacterium]
MAEKNDDIKQLFSHLGLNPNDYQEIRSAPTASATVTEAPRRWSLLQAAAPARHAQAPVAAGLPVAAPPVTQPLPAAAPQPDAMTASNLFSAALRATAEDILRAETSGSIAPRAAPSTAAVALPSALSAALAEPSADQGLQSLFQSVKEPQTVSIIPPAPEVLVTQRRTELIFDRPPVPTSLTERAGAMAPEPTKAVLDMSPISMQYSPEEPETRYSPPPSRLGPVPVTAPSMPEPAAPAAAGSGRLRFAASAAAAPAASHGESLQDVFARLSRDNRR